MTLSVVSLSPACGSYRHGPPSLHRVRRHSFPGFTATLQPSDTLVPSADAVVPLTFGLPSRRALFLFVWCMRPLTHQHRRIGFGSPSCFPLARRRARALPGFWVVLFAPAAIDHPLATSDSAACAATGLADGRAGAHLTAAAGVTATGGAVRRSALPGSAAGQRGARGEAQQQTQQHPLNGSHVGLQSRPHHNPPTGGDSDV